MTTSKSLQIGVAYGGLNTATASYCPSPPFSLQIIDGRDRQDDGRPPEHLPRVNVLSEGNKTFADVTPKSP